MSQSGSQREGYLPSPHLKNAESVELESANATSPSLIDRTRSHIKLQDIPPYQRTNAKNALGMIMREQYPASVQLAHFHSKVTMGPPGLRYLQSKTTKEVEEVPYCPCCGRRIIREDVSMCYHTSLPWEIEEGEEKFRLSSGVSLFFETIKILSIYLMMRLVLLDAFNMYSSYHGEYCKSHSFFCTSFIQSIFSGYNNHHEKDARYQLYLQILNLVLTVLSIPYFAYCRLRFIRVSEFIDHMDITDDDFSIMVQHIPSIIRDLRPEQERKRQNSDQEPLMKDLYIQEDLNRNVEEYLVRYFTDKVNQIFIRQGQSSQIEADPVVNVTLAYDNTEFDNINQLSQNIISELQEHQGPVQHYQVEYEQKYRRLREGRVDSELSQQQKERLWKFEVQETSRIFKTNILHRLLRQDPSPKEGYIPQYLRFLGHIDHLGERAARAYINSDPEITQKNFKGIAFLTFKKESMRNLLVEEYEKNPDALKINGVSIMVSEPSEPQDILWENLSFPSQKRKKIFIMNMMVLFMCIGFSFAICLTSEAIQISGNDFEDYQSHLSGEQTEFAKSSLQGDILNYGMIVLTYIANYWLGWVIERITVLERQKSSSQLVVELVVRNVVAKFFNTCMVYFILQLLFIESANPLGPNGLVAKIFQIVVLLGIIDATINLVQPERTITYLLTLKQYKDRSFAPLTQEELNSELARPEFDIVDRYSFYIFNTYLVSFYAVFIPQTTPIMLITFLFQYWIDKYNMFRRNSFTMKLNYRLSLVAIQLCEYTMLLSAIGSTIFFYWIDVPPMTLIEWILQVASIIACGVYLAVAHYAPQRIVELLGFEEQGINTSYETFRQEYVNINTFWSQNPATERIGKLSAKAMKDQNMNKSIKLLSTQAFGSFESEKQVCERSLRSLFLPHHLEKYWDAEERYEPYFSKYKKEEKQLFSRCFSKQ